MKTYNPKKNPDQRRKRTSRVPKQCRGEGSTDRTYLLLIERFGKQDYLAQQPDVPKAERFEAKRRAKEARASAQPLNRFAAEQAVARLEGERGSY